MIQRIKRLLPVPLKKFIKKFMGGVVSRNKYDATKEYVVNLTENKRFEDNVAIVTGGSGAIGRAISFRLALEGATVFVAGRTKAKVENVVKEITKKNGRAMPLIMDVTDSRSIQEAVNNVLKQFSKIDVLINCAGGSSRNLCGYLHEQSIDVIDAILNTNLRGSILCSRQVSKQMVQKKSGKIVNIASVIGVRGKARFTEYAAAKAGIIGYTASLAIELGPMGINVNCVSPGFIQRGQFNDETVDKLARTNYLRKVGTLEDVANAAVFLASNEASFITGQNLIVDGGRSLGLHGDN